MPIAAAAALCAAMSITLKPAVNGIALIASWPDPWLGNRSDWVLLLRSAPELELPSAVAARSTTSLSACARSLAALAICREHHNTRQG